MKLVMAHTSMHETKGRVSDFSNQVSGFVQMLLSFCVLICEAIFRLNRLSELISGKFIQSKNRNLTGHSLPSVL